MKSVVHFTHKFLLSRIVHSLSFEQADEEDAGLSVIQRALKRARKSSSVSASM
jgi:hypothetical protein